MLLVYGGGSIKKNGLYDKVISALNEAEADVFELSGVEPNPRLTTVQKGIDICQNENIDFLLAVGGEVSSTVQKPLQLELNMMGMFGILFQRKRPLKSTAIWHSIDTCSDRLRNEPGFCDHELGNK